MENQKTFRSSFGFLMAAVGSAVGVGNIWGFPYKMGSSGGFAFLLCYILLCVIGGFIVMQGELVVGRRAGKGVVADYRAAHPKAGFIGWFGIIAIIVLGGFCCTLTAYCLKYFFANLGDLLGLGFGTGGADPATYWAAFLNNGGESTLLTILSIVLTVIIIFKGTKGIENFCKVAMPCLVGLLVIVIIKANSLPGSGAGLAFIFKPDFSVFKGTGWITVFAKAGSQAFFSQSLAMAIMVTYGAYLPKKESIEKQTAMIIFFDTLVAVLAGCAVFPAVFAFGQEPTGGTSLLFVTLQCVFNEMGKAGPFFGAIFYLLVAIAELTSLTSIFEAPVAFFEDVFKEKQKKFDRNAAIIIVAALNAVFGIIVALDGLGSNGLVQPMGFCWLDFLDLITEGILIPVGALCLVVLIGWLLPKKFMSDEIEQEGVIWKTKKFSMFCMKWVTPIVVLFIFIAQMNSFFGLGWF